MTRFTLAASVCLLSTAVAHAAGDDALVRLDPALDQLVAPDAKVELVKGGFGFTEGPVWMTEGNSGYLLFTDIPGNVVWKLTPDGKASVYLQNVGYQGPEVWRWGGIQNNGFDRNDQRFEEFSMTGADGLTVDRQGRLILATFGGRSLMRIEKDGKRTVLADSYGHRFGGPNDVVVKSDGAISFTDTYGSFRLREKDPRKELASPASTCGRRASFRCSPRTCRWSTASPSRPTRSTSTSTAAATITSIATRSSPTARSPTASCSST
jgi:hypothetical protein